MVILKFACVFIYIFISDIHKILTRGDTGFIFGHNTPLNLQKKWFFHFFEFLIFGPSRAKKPQILAPKLDFLIWLFYIKCDVRKNLSRWPYFFIPYFNRGHSELQIKKNCASSGKIEHFISNFVLILNVKILCNP